MKNNTSLNINSIKNNAHKYSSQKLCEMIACARYFDMDQNIPLICMKELSNRRINGDSFIFEEVIEKCFNELPPLNLDVPDLRTMLKGIIK